MATKKSSWVLIALFVISVGLLCSVPQAMAETMNHKAFLHVTQSQNVQIGDVANHWVGYGMVSSTRTFSCNATFEVVINGIE
jgi:hypothetical protein